MDQSQSLDWGEFSTSDAAAAADVTKNVIADWITRGLINIKHAPGRGRDRVFTLWNIVEAIVASNLNKAGIRTGPLKMIMGVLEMESRVNTSTRRPGGFDDFFVVIRFTPAGTPSSMYREADHHRRPDWYDDEPTVMKLRIDVSFAISHARKVLKL